MSVFEDAFTDTAGTALTSHIPVLLAGGAGSGTWSGAAAIAITDANRVRTGTGSSGVSAIGSIATATVEHDVEADYVLFTNLGAGLSAGIVACGDTNTTDHSRRGYQVQLDGSTLTLRAVSTSSITLGTVSGATWNTGGGATAVYHVKLSIRLGGGTYTFTVFVTRSDGQYLKSDGTYQAGVIAAITTTLLSSDTNAPGGGGSIPAIGKPGVFWFQTTASNAAGLHLDNLLVKDAIATLTAGALTLSTSGPGGPVIAYGGSSGGTGTIHNYFHRSTTANFTPSGTVANTGTCIAVDPAFPYTDAALAPTTIYYYKVQAIDAASTTTTSNQVIGRIWAAAIVFGMIGDSIALGYPGVGTTPIDECAARLALTNKERSVTVGSNSAQSGSSAASWQPGSGNYLAAKAAFLAASVTDVVIMLGTNDASDGPTFQTNVSNIITQLFIDLAATLLRVHLSYQPYVVEASEPFANSTFILYQAALEALDNGGTIRVIGRLVYPHFGEFQTQLQNDGIHPTATGDRSIGTIWANDLNVHLNPSTGARRAPVLHRVRN